MTRRLPRSWGQLKHGLKPMVVYRLTAKAVRGIDGIYEHGILNFELGQSRIYLSGLHDRLSDIAEHPLQWPSVNEIREGYRRNVYISHSIYYRTINGNVAIIRVLGQQDIDDAFLNG